MGYWSGCMPGVSSYAQGLPCQALSRSTLPLLCTQPASTAACWDSESTPARMTSALCPPPPAPCTSCPAQAPGVAKYKPELMYPRPSPGTLEVDPSMKARREQEGMVGGRRLQTRSEGPRMLGQPLKQLIVFHSEGSGGDLGWVSSPAHLPLMPVQWVHPAVNGVALAEDPRTLHNDLHTYLHGEGVDAELRLASELRCAHTQHGPPQACPCCRVRRGWREGGCSEHHHHVWLPPG